MTNPLSQEQIDTLRGYQESGDSVGGYNYLNQISTETGVGAPVSGWFGKAVFDGSAKQSRTPTCLWL